MGVENSHRSEMADALRADPLQWPDRDPPDRLTFFRQGDSLRGLSDSWPIEREIP